MCKSVEGVNGRAGQIIDWMRWVSQVLIVPLLGVAFMMWLNHEDRIDQITLTQAVMQGNRFTSQDGKEVWAAVASLETKKANSSDVPPPEVIAALERIDHRLEKLEDQMIELIKANGGK